LLPCLAASGARPTLSGAEQTLDSSDGFFRVHYTEEGSDAPSGGDIDGDGIPDAVTRILDALAVGREAYRDAGYRELSVDDGGGGSDAIDVYVRAIDANGYAHALNGQATDGGASCYMQIDGDLGDLSDLVIESVTVHELHHCIAYRYTTDAHSWVVESAATFEQYRVITDPLLEAALGILYFERLQGSDRSIDDLDGRYEYAGFLWWKFWTEDGGRDAARAPALWEALADASWDEAMGDESWALWGRSLEETFTEYATWNAFACARDDGAHYSGDDHPCLVDTQVTVETVTDTLTSAHDVAPFTATYHELTNEGDDRPVALDCEGTLAGTEARLRLLALTADGAVAETAALVLADQTMGRVALTGALDPDGTVLVVVASTGEGPAEVTCEASRVELPKDEEPDGEEPIEEEPIEEATADPEGCGCGVTGARFGGLLAVAICALRRRRSRRLGVARVTSEPIAEDAT